MFDIGWTEMLVIGVVAIIFVGPRELPGMLRTAGQVVRKLRGMAGDFQRQMDDALREAELDGLKDSVNEVRKLNPTTALKDSLNPLKADLEKTRSEIAEAAKPEKAQAAKKSETGSSEVAEIKAVTPSEVAGSVKNSDAGIAGAPKSAGTKATAKKPTVTKKATVKKTVAKNGLGKKTAKKPAASSASTEAVPSPAQKKRKAPGPAKSSAKAGAGVEKPAAKVAP